MLLIKWSDADADQVRSWISSQILSVPLCSQIRNVETNQCVDNMGRKENEKVGFFNCHGMGGNQVSLADTSNASHRWKGQATKCVADKLNTQCPSAALPLQVFSYTADKEIRTDDLCLDVSRLNGPVVMLKCHHMKGNQMFEYDAEVGLLTCCTGTAQ